MAKIIGIVIIASVVIALLSAVGSLVVDSTTFDYDSDSFAIAGAVPRNLTLTGTDPRSLIDVTNCTTETVPASNYTDYVSDGFLQLDENSTITGSNVCVQYLKGDRVSGVAAVLLGLIALFIVVQWVRTLIGKSATR